MAFRRIINFKTSKLWDDLLEKAHEFRMDRSELIFSLIMKGFKEIRHLKSRPKWLDRKERTHE